ncbi:MAG: MIP family channel protein [Clostridiales bacterium]|jgi:aquaporin Z|nr:MIP family channel protein [Clostridiales bacterium]
MKNSFDWKKAVAEVFGTFVLVFVACGVAALTGGSLVPTALSFGLVIVAMAYVIGPISGCHINPAVSLAFALNKRISWIEFLWYVIAQFVGAIIGAAVLLFVLNSVVNSGEIISLGQNGFGEAPNVSVWGALVVEIILTFIFVLTILAVTSKKSAAGKKAGIIIGLTLTLVHLIGIGLTGTSVNPARSFGPALLIGGDALAQVWLFIVAPLVGAALAAVFGKLVINTEAD